MSLSKFRANEPLSVPGRASATDHSQCHSAQDGRAGRCSEMSAMSQRRDNHKFWEYPRVSALFFRFLHSPYLTQETQIVKARKGSAGEYPGNKCRIIFAAGLLSIYLANSLTSFHPL